MKYIYYLSLGANLGDRLKTITKAIEAIERLGRVAAVSRMYETPPWGKLDQPVFINCAAVVAAERPPLDFLHGCQDVEKALGRIRHEHWGARTIDIDILYALEAVDSICDTLAAESVRNLTGQDDCKAIAMQTEELRLPHPYMLARAFVMVPLAELAPELVLACGRTARKIAESLPDRKAIVSLS